MQPRAARIVEPWSSCVVLPIFALANAGVARSTDVFRGHRRLMLAITLGLVFGKSIGIVTGASLAVRSGIAVKPDAYSWRQLVGAGALGGIGFTMSLFIAGAAFPDTADFAAASDRATSNRLSLWMADRFTRLFAPFGTGSPGYPWRYNPGSERGLNGVEAYTCRAGCGSLVVENRVISNSACPASCHDSQLPGKSSEDHN